MKQFKIVLSMAIAVFCFTAVHAQSTKTGNITVTADTVVYQCPMKCEGDKTYNKTGKCPKCNMDLKVVPNQIPVTAVYLCPMKCEGDKTYVNAGKCPVCKMNLTKMEAKKQPNNHKGHNHN